MKFNELHEETKERARDALCAVVARGSVNSASAKLAGETVAAAFIAMEQYESGPDGYEIHGPDGKVLFSFSTKE
ncbi:hypothetical protein OSC13_09950 [Serratia marcescens]|uniref:hypothetical protein n=1 Tax=Serratia marcescens TaxID=615 RepID=UPI002875C7D4|nr:hypothetical protein [Serratia marcescens]MDS0778218.1 hypothetical protein [Serratia marcescens]